MWSVLGSLSLRQVSRNSSRPEALVTSQSVVAVVEQFDALSRGLLECTKTVQKRCIQSTAQNAGTTPWCHSGPVVTDQSIAVIASARCVRSLHQVSRLRITCDLRRVEKGWQTASPFSFQAVFISRRLINGVSRRAYLKQRLPSRYNVSASCYIFWLYHQPVRS